MKIVHDVGTGDFFNVEPLWDTSRKASLEVLYHAFPQSPGSDALIATLKACPTYQHVEHRGLIYPTEPIPGAIKTLREHAIGHRLPYHGSAFLTDPLECDVPAGLPDRFDYLQPSTPKNGPRMREDPITPPEWPPILARLEARDTIGLVLNSPGGKAEVPEHPRILDWTGRTTMPQSIEILKRATGYIGVDSCFAILAAQLFGSADLWVRTNNPFVVTCPFLHYRPQTDFTFLFPRFDQPPHPVASPMVPLIDGVIVELRCNALVGSRNFTAGDLVEISSLRAQAMIKAGLAVGLPDRTAIDF